VKSMLGGKVRYLWTGSAPAESELIRFFMKFGVPLYQGYGLNEAPLVAKNCPVAWRMGSVGRPLPNRDVRIGEDGEVLVRHRYPAAAGYLGFGEAENEKTFRPDGYVATGDLGRIDSDGFLYVCGRKKELLVLPSGRKLNPADIESRILSTDKVAECLVMQIDADALTLVTRLAEGVPVEGVMDAVRSDNGRRTGEEMIRDVVAIEEPLLAAAGVQQQSLKVSRRELQSALLRRIVAGELVRRSVRNQFSA
jgi:long-chain acyl-CoA synthetase